MIYDEASSDFDFAFRHYLGCWVRGNRWLGRASSSYTQLLVWNNGQIIFDMDLLVKWYQDKFIEPDFLKYCTDFLTKFICVINDYLKNKDYDFNQMEIVFRYKKQTLICSFNYPIDNKDCG